MPSPPVAPLAVLVRAAVVATVIAAVALVGLAALTTASIMYPNFRSAGLSDPDSPKIIMCKDAIQRTVLYLTADLKRDIRLHNLSALYQQAVHDSLTPLVPLRSSDHVLSTVLPY